jgi:lipopolysaccharide export system protein LptA
LKQGEIVKAHRLLQAAKRMALAAQVVLMIIAPMLLSPAAIAEERSQADASNGSDEPIQIVADKLITNNAEKFAEFSGDVRASQGNMIMTSERLRIYYQEDNAGGNQQTGRQEAIKQVVASGNVRVKTEKYTAEAERVEYDVASQVVVLIGENSTVTSGKNTLTGSKITMDRKNGHIKVDSNPQQRVKAVFYPNKDMEKKE